MRRILLCPVLFLLVGIAAGDNLVKNPGFESKEIVAPLQRVPGAVGLQLVLGLQQPTGTLWFDDIAITPLGKAGDLHGTVTMAPTEPGVAGTTVPVRFEVALGTRGLAAGGSIQLRWEDWRAGREFRFGKVRVTCDRQGAAFAVATPPKKKSLALNLFPKRPTT